MILQQQDLVVLTFKHQGRGEKKKTLELNQDLAEIISLPVSKNMMVVSTHILLLVINILMVQLITKMVFSTICCRGSFQASAKLSPLSETVPINEHNFGRLVYGNPRMVFVQVYIYIYVYYGLFICWKQREWGFEGYCVFSIQLTSLVLKVHEEDLLGA